MFFLIYEKNLGVGKEEAVVDLKISLVNMRRIMQSFVQNICNIRIILYLYTLIETFNNKVYVITKNTSLLKNTKFSRSITYYLLLIYLYNET